MGRRVDRLVTHIRSITENDTLNSNTDIEDEEIIQFLNEGIQHLQAKIIKQYPRVFLAETTISTVADQEEYNLPVNAFLFNRLVHVDYSTDGTTYYPLKPAYYKDRDRNSGISSLPYKYIRRDILSTASASLLLVPKPVTTGQTIRINYIRKLDGLDKRRGIVSAVTLATSTITALTLDTSGNPPVDSDAFDDNDYFCVVDAIGAVKMRNVRYDSISSSTGVVTVNSTFSFDSGETITIGDYIVCGKDTSTHCQLPDSVERFLIKFAAWEILKNDSSIDSSEAIAELAELRDEIIDSYSEMDESITDVPVDDDWWDDY